MRELNQIYYSIRVSDGLWHRSIEMSALVHENSAAANTTERIQWAKLTGIRRVNLMISVSGLQLYIRNIFTSFTTSALLNVATHTIQMLLSETYFLYTRTYRRQITKCQNCNSCNVILSSSASLLGRSFGLYVITFHFHCIRLWIK